jgi:hypothetical protein
MIAAAGHPTLAASRDDADRCFYCRRGMHTACTRGERPCACEPHDEDQL